MRKKNPEYFLKIEKYIEDYKEANGNAPTMYEIAEGINLSKTTVQRYLSCLRDQGKLYYSKHRGIVTQVQVPFLRGSSKYSEENITESIPLPIALFGRDESFLCTVEGDSMIDVGINDGDIVVIRRQNTADEGQIVSVLLEAKDLIENSTGTANAADKNTSEYSADSEGETVSLLKYYPEPKNNRIRLHPENKNMKDIFVMNCTIQGVVISSIKNIEHDYMKKQAQV